MSSVSPYVSVAEELNKRRADEAQAEKARLDAHQARVRNFKAPEVHEGMDVFWFQAANDKATPSIAKVKRIREQGRMVDLSIFGSAETYEAVRHLHDPALANVNLRERGAWSYTDAYMVEQSWRNNLLEMIEAFKEEVTALRAEVAALKPTDRLPGKK